MNQFDELLYLVQISVEDSMGNLDSSKRKAFAIKVKDAVQVEITKNKLLLKLLVTSPTLQRVRALIRPIFTIWIILFLTMFIFFPNSAVKVAASLSQLPSELWVIITIVMTFWFGERAVNHVLEKYNGGKRAVK